MLSIKKDWDGENKTIMPSLNSSWIVNLWIYGERRTQIPLSSPATIVHCQGSRIDRLYTDEKSANSTKINHKMVPCINHYTAISIDRLPSKTKIGKYSWYFDFSLLCKSEVSSAARTFLFLLKTHKKTSTAVLPPPSI